MALRLRRDVQKASYYVWFLGAEEAKGLRGPDIINPVLPYLIENSQKQEPLKVTLQVSHKGIKIIQESSKHFIPHSAITSSVQRDDIVACVLLLYNPATKCPIHIHAYRCDSETTAEALHQQLQILINRPDNQKRFAELESKLDSTHSSSLLNSLKQKRNISSGGGGRFENRFISTLSNDTGISSVKESEGGSIDLEHSISPKSPLPKPKGNLFDSLAAELRAKLNGNGPPLLLPPRDYDTVHRSKGNLAAIELRRCQNSMIVGATTATTTTTGSTKQVSSRGSSGIGSDLAPSPERQDDHTSSEEDNWSNEADNSIDALKTPLARQTLVKRFCEDIDEHKDNYLRDLPSKNLRHGGGGGGGNSGKDLKTDFGWKSGRENEIRPTVIRSSTHKSWENETSANRHPISKGKDAHGNDSKIVNNEYPDEHDRRYNRRIQQQQQHRESYERDDYELEKPVAEYNKLNLTDRQKYQKTYSGNVHQKIEAYNTSGKYKADSRRSPENHRYHQEIRARPMRHNYYPSPERERELSKSIPNTGTTDRYGRAPVNVDEDVCGIGQQDYERNPYKEPESLPYRESIEKMLKSPIMQYKSFDNNVNKASLQSPTVGIHINENHPALTNKMELTSRRSHPSPHRDENYLIHDGGERSSYVPPIQRRHHYHNSHSSSTVKATEHHHKHNHHQENNNVLKVSFKEKFHEAKEKFRAMEKSNKLYTSDQQINNCSNPSSQNFHEYGSGSGGSGRRGAGDYFDGNDEPSCCSDNWSDDEKHNISHRNHPNSRGNAGGISRNYPRYSSKRKDDLQLQSPQSPPIMTSKSLSNLVKGYRHSYAEPRPALPRSSGRVGLAAVNPF